jgi:hypothetical protein
MGQTPMTPIVTTWLTTNIGGYAKRAISIAMFLLSSSVAGVLGSQLYKSRNAPHYSKSRWDAFFFHCAPWPKQKMTRNLLQPKPNESNTFFFPFFYFSLSLVYVAKGHLVNIGMMVTIMLFSLLQRFIMKRENTRRNYSVSYGVNPLKILTKAEMRDITDKHPAYRYTL